MQNKYDGLLPNVPPHMIDDYDRYEGGLIRARYDQYVAAMKSEKNWLLAMNVVPVVAAVCVITLLLVFAYVDMDLERVRTGTFWMLGLMGATLAFVLFALVRAQKAHGIAAKMENHLVTFKQFFEVLAGGGASWNALSHLFLTQRLEQYAFNVSVIESRWSRIRSECQPDMPALRGFVRDYDTASAALNLFCSNMDKLRRQYDKRAAFAKAESQLAAK